MQPRGQQSYNVAPTDREGRKLDALECKIYSFSALGLRISNYQAVMAGYQLFLWEGFSHISDCYLRRNDPSLSCFGLRQSNRANNWLMAVAVQLTQLQERGQLCCFAALCLGQVDQTTCGDKTRAEDLPFEGATWFLEKIDETFS